MAYLLDTNACIALLNDSSKALLARIRNHHPDDFYYSSVVHSELCFGARKSRFVSRNLAAIRRMSAPFRPLDFDSASAEEYGTIRAELQALGTPIGPYDLLIAAAARAHSLTVVTRNLREFQQVVALEVEDWF